MAGFTDGLRPAQKAATGAAAFCLRLRSWRIPRSFRGVDRLVRRRLGGAVQTVWAAMLPSVEFAVPFALGFTLAAGAADPNPIASAPATTREVTVLIIPYSLLFLISCTPIPMCRSASTPESGFVLNILRMPQHRRSRFPIQGRSCCGACDPHRAFAWKRRGTNCKFDGNTARSNALYRSICRGGGQL